MLTVEKTLMKEAGQILGDMERVDQNKSAIEKLDDKDAQVIADHERDQLTSEHAHKDLTMAQKMGMGMRDKLKQKLVQERLETSVELVRRKLDFDVIKDNYENKITKEIIHKYADLDAGLPGTNFKFQKVKHLIQRRREEIEKHIQEAKIKKKMDKELAHVKTKEARNRIQAKYEAKMNHGD